MVAVVLLGMLLLKLLGFLGAVVRFLLGDETAISRYFARSRERKGFDALSDGMVALASGDSRLATKKAQKADKLLNRPDLTLLLTAQAAELSGDRGKAFEAYKALLPNDRTRPVGVQGLMRLKLDEGDTDTAMALAQEGLRAQPRQRAGAQDAVRPAVEEGGLGRRARDAERDDARAAAAARRRHPARRGAVAGRRPRRARRGRHRARQRGGAAGEPAGADADPGRGARGAGAGGAGVEAQGDARR